MLLSKTNKKWHTPCQIRWKSFILDDPESQYAPSWLNGTRYGLGSYWSLIGNRIPWFLRSGEVRENQSTKVQKLKKMQKTVWTVLRRVHTTVQIFFCSLRSQIFFYLLF